MIRSGTAIQALPSFLDKLVPAWGAILMSVTLILAFGEVIKHSWLVSASIPWSMISYMYFLYFITVGKVVMDGSIIDSPVKGLRREGSQCWSSTISQPYCEPMKSFSCRNGSSNSNSTLLGMLYRVKPALFFLPLWLHAVRRYGVCVV